MPRVCPWIVLCLSAFLAAPASSATRSGDVQVSPGVRIHYAERGAANGPALLFVPGWGMDASIWDRQITEFSRQHRVVAIDPRSQGASSKPTEGNSPRVRASDIDAVMRDLSLYRVVLVGWSQGVQDVAAYVDRFGTSRLAGVVLVDSAVSAGAAGIEEHPDVARQTFERLSLYEAHPREYLQGMMKAIMLQPVPPAEQQHRLEVALQMPVSTGIAMLTQDLYGTDLRPALKKFDRPTLVVAAAASPELAVQEAMAGQIAQGKFVSIEDAGHAVFVDQPARFNQVLREFLAGIEP